LLRPLMHSTHLGHDVCAGAGRLNRQWLPKALSIT
jgi:hypothetical protein